jgi:hypothetical protein
MVYYPYPDYVRRCMRLTITRSKNSESLYVIESTYIASKHSSRVVEKLGTTDALRLRLNGRDPIE